MKHLLQQRFHIGENFKNDVAGGGVFVVGVQVFMPVFPFGWIGKGEADTVRMVEVCVWNVKVSLLVYVRIIDSNWLRPYSIVREVGR